MSDLIEGLLNAKTETSVLEPTATDPQPEKEEEQEPKPEEAKKEEASEAPPSPEVKAEEPPNKETLNKDVPFHKHPRWMRLQQEQAQLRAANEALEAKLKEMNVSPAKAAQVLAETPSEFRPLFGDDAEAYTAWQNFLKAKVREEAENILNERSQAEKAKQEKAEAEKQQFVAWAEDQLAELSDEMGVDLTDAESSERNQILNLIVENELLYADGRPNIKAAYKMYQALYPTKTDDTLEEKRKIISKTNSKSGVAPSKEILYTHDNLKKMDISQFLN